MTIINDEDCLAEDAFNFLIEKASLTVQENKKQQSSSSSTQVHSPAVPPMPNSTIGHKPSISMETREVASATKSHHSLPYSEEDVEEGGVSYTRFKEINDSKGEPIVFSSTIRPDDLKELLSVKLDEEGFIDKVIFEDVGRTFVSDLLKERFTGKNLSDPKAPPIAVPEPCSIPSHFMIASRRKRFVRRNVTPNPKKVAVKANKSLGGQPPKHPFAAHLSGPCRGSVDGCSSMYDAGIVEGELVAFSEGETRDLKIQFIINGPCQHLTDKTYHRYQGKSRTAEIDSYRRGKNSGKKPSVIANQVSAS